MRHRFVEDTPVHPITLTRICASGCKRHGKHATEVEPEHRPCVEGCPRWCPEHCTGCEPRRVIHPNDMVCAGCEARLRGALARIPGVVRWIRVHATKGSNHTEPTSGSRTPPAPLNLQAVDDADELHALLTNWSLIVADDNSAGLRMPGVKGPDLTGTHRVDMRPTVRHDRSGNPLWSPDAGGDAAGTSVTSGLGTITDPAKATARVATWLTAFTPYAITRQYAPDLVDELHQAARTFLARYPHTEDSTRLPAPCPACERQSLVRLPPTREGGQVTILCDYSTCGELIREELYEWHTRMLNEERKAGKRPKAG